MSVYTCRSFVSKYISWFVLACSGMHAWSGQALAGPPTEAQAVAEMQRIQDGWKKILEQNSVFLARCGSEPAYKRVGIAGYLASFDIRKTDSILHPYQGVIVIEGFTRSNESSSQANGVTIGDQRFCFKTIDEAINNSDIEQRFNPPQRYTFTLIYTDNGQEKFIISSYDAPFYNGFYENIQPMLHDPYNKQIAAVLFGASE